MPYARRFRTSAARGVLACALALGAGGLLAACGGDDATVTSTPTPTSTLTSAASDSSEPAPVTTPGEAATAPPSEPAPVPGDFPGPAEVPVSSEGQAFLDALRAKGIETAGDGSIAVSSADYICQAKREGLSDSDTKIFVTAMVGTEASASGVEVTPEDADQRAQIYIDVAHAEYCK